MGLCDHVREGRREVPREADRVRRRPDGELLERATHWARDGSLKHKEDIVGGLENAPEAFLGMPDGKNFGNLLVPVS
jgi:NADPH-dependent curcumin reductase CurA